MRNQRCKALIVIEILETCKDVTSRSKIVDASNMNFKTIKPYLAALAKNGLIETDDGTVYSTTEKGLEALGHLRALEEMLSKFL